MDTGIALYTLWAVLMVILAHATPLGDLALPVWVGGLAVAYWRCNRGH